MPKRLTALLLLIPPTVRATGVLAEWVSSAKDYLAAEIMTPELRATRTCSSVILDWIPLADPSLLYTLERRPDLALNWKWTALSIEDVSSTMIMYNDTAIDNSREYTYRLRVGPNAGNTKNEFTYAIASPATSCMQWSEVASSMIYSLRIRMDGVLATVARITFLLLGIHLVLLGLRNYLGLTPPRGHLQREKIKNITHQESTSSNELRRRAAFSSASCSSTETESDADAPRLSLSQAASVASSAQISTASTRNLDVKDQRCHGCHKRFGLFRKRRVCSVCNMGLCRPCGITRTSIASKRYICLPCRALESMPV
ncbi:hypothetical protein THRCLA_01916 [Thraustotheca clavata]|uniref:FYVE-type domain-containing protein n=1 Tax=Thraustotheca clavata TaxID=74557 RepID=A0A1W0A6U8_9STRA|nr:hypothetical protein THRCLA_01916 [Thraustotheca clavata]